MLMARALQVPSQLIQKGSWDKGKRIAITSCIYNGSRVTMWSLAYQDHPDCPLGIGMQQLVEAREPALTAGWHTHMSAQGRSPGERHLGCQGLSL